MPDIISDVAFQFCKNVVKIFVKMILKNFTDFLSSHFT